ncbi:MAG: hemolysin family protein [Dehalococcoidales bacterium]|nr:hemolysin family protein [Dehalococcoidales bacterium]
MDGVHLLYLILFLVCLVLAAFFCSAETAFIGMQKLRLQHLIHTGSPKAKIVARIVEHPEKFLATVLRGINFFETAVATLGTLMAVSLFQNENLGAAVATIVVTVLTLIFAELVPKSLAVRYGERLALFYATPIEITSVILYPFVFVLNHIGIRFTRLVGENDEAKPTISEAEFRTAITVGEAEGVVGERAAEMLHNVFDFGNRPVREVMVPRPEVIFIEQGSTLADFLKLFAQYPLTRFPVYHEKRDNVVGILSVKDVLMAQAKGTITNDSLIDDLARPAYFTPETKRISELFVEMKDKNCRMAIVVDEFGGTAGIVSLTRLVEEIVGPVGDELAETEKDYEVIDEYTFQIDGGMRVEEANEEMGLNLPEGDYETVAGFVLHLLGRIPKQGEQLKYRDFKLVITKMSGVKIEEVLVTREKVIKENKDEPREKNAAFAD